MKAINKSLELAMQAIKNEDYEEAAEFALDGIKKTKNKKTPRLNTMFIQILNYAVRQINNGPEAAKKERYSSNLFFGERKNNIRIVK